MKAQPVAARQAALGISPLVWKWRRTHPPPCSSLWQTAVHWYINLNGMDLLEPGIALAVRFKRLIGSAIRGLLLAVCAFFLWWPIGVGILAGIGTDEGKGEHGFNHWPEPQVFKIIFGGTLGLFLVPLMAWFALLATDTEPPAISEMPAMQNQAPYNLPQDDTHKV